MKLEFTSMLARDHFEDLKALLFFHPDQNRFHRSIVVSVERHGQPAIVERNGGLRVELDRLEDVQTLFAMVHGEDAGELAGVAIYTRTMDGILDVLHCAVKEEYTLRGGKSEMGVMFSLMEELCRIGRRVQGIHSVRLAYDRGKVVLEPVVRDDGAGVTM